MHGVQVYTPNSAVTARNRDRSRFASWGVLGGKAGTVSRFLRNPGTAHEEDLGVHDFIHCQPGDVIRLEGCGGGGYGSPWERDPARVLHDVRCGYVSVENARGQYGVVIEGGEVSRDATARLRAELAGRDPAVAHYDHGAGRDAFEAVWTLARYERMTHHLAGVAPIWRHFLKIKIFDALEQRLGGNVADTRPEIVDEIFAQLLKACPQLQAASA